MQWNGNVPVPYYTSLLNINNAEALFFSFFFLQKDVALEEENCKQISRDRDGTCSRQHQALMHVRV